MTAATPDRVLVASDLHLASGWDPVTDTCVATENFLADDAFAAWLEHYRPDAARTLLVLNGDVFDVLRVDAVPDTGAEFERWSERLGELGAPRPVAELRASISRSERRYGLQTDDYKTVWKLLRTAAGHERFFRALAEWARAGGRLLFVTGNHDVELHWPLVRAAIRDELRRHGAPADGLADAVGFAGEHVAIDNLYIEHGHAHEEMTRVDGPPTLPPDHQQINLPLGSFVNRYFINRVEALDPFIDNVKPVQDALLRLARQRPLRMIRTYWGGWRFIRRAVAKRRFNRAVLTILLLLSLPFLAPLLLFAVPGAREALLGWLPVGGTARAGIALLSGGALTGVLPYLLGVVSDLRSRRPRVDHHMQAARRAIASHLADCGRSRVYVCMGHTHVTAVKKIDDEGRQLYLNTGTWIALWPRNRPDLLGRTVYTYALFEATPDDGYRGQILEWSAAGRRPQRATILVPAAA